MAVPVMLPESEVSRIIRLSRNAQFARAYLEKGIRVPSFPEILSAYSGIRDPAELQERLSVRLRGMLGEPNDASIRRKVATWFARKTAPDNREQLVRIVFALEMTEEQAQNFLASAGGGCLHQRNPIELAYLYALRNRLSYHETMHLIARVRDVATGGGGKTKTLESEFTKVRGEQAFVDFISRESMNLGQMHNTAYEYFTEYMQVLIRPPEVFPELPEREYSVREVATWFARKTAPDNREQLVRIVFALEMTEEQAQNFLASAGGGCLHQRNPIELAYLYALRNRLSYHETMHLIARVRDVATGGGGKTKTLESEFTKVRGEQAFVDFISRESMNLGQMHNTAYEYFTEYMQVLIRPPEVFPELPEREYSVREIVQMYLKPPTAQNSVLAKSIRAHWPDEKTLSQIINRRVDVSRKVLILLFLVTDGAESGASLSDDSRVLFDDRYRRVNQMLDDCSYSQLDPRNVFDWLMLYCMYDNGELSENERLQAVLRETEENDALGGDQP